MAPVRSRQALPSNSLRKPVKKRIFIAIHYMEIGGAERALLGVLSSLPPEQYEIDLFIYSHQGPFMDYIPEYVHVLPEQPAYACFEKPLRQVIHEGHGLMAAARLWAKVADRIHNRHLTGEVSSILDEVGRATARVLPSLSYLGEYDLAISFLTPHYIVRDKVRARTKIAWIHTDYSVISINAARELPVWAAYDRIISISSSVTQGFLGVFPSLESKIIELENPLPTALITAQADAFDARPEMPGELVLLSIGRFCTQKNFPYAVDTMAELCKLRRDAHWYIIGYGGDEALIRQRIAEKQMQDYVTILGKKTNPYPYIKACDLYVQPSLYEGKAVTVKEAQLLRKPVAITAFPTAKSQLNDGVDGIILPLGNAAETAQALHELLNNKPLLQELATQCRKTDYSGQAEFRRVIDSLIS